MVAPKGFVKITGPVFVVGILLTKIQNPVMQSGLVIQNHPIGLGHLERNFQTALALKIRFGQITTVRHPQIHGRNHQKSRNQKAGLETVLEISPQSRITQGHHQQGLPGILAEQLRAVIPKGIHQAINAFPLLAIVQRGRKIKEHGARHGQQQTKAAQNRKGGIESGKQLRAVQLSV